MSYQVIARKYRPQRFVDVVGQEHVTRTLSQAIEQERIAHAYLFCGPRGTGKTTVARIFAKCLNCTGGPKVDFDDADPRCIEISEGRSLDVLEIDGASNNGVEQVRELRETCRYAPASSKFKIYIIDEVHMLSTAAFNALLKTLEEPPEHVKFMFATTDPEKVLPTILSRCQRFDLRRIPTALISSHLAAIAKQENVTVDPTALYAIARGAEGGMRDAESTLDQLISFCGRNIEEADVLSMFGLTAQRQLLEMAEAVLTGNVEGALRQLNELTANGKDLGRLISDLLNHVRNLLIYQVSKGDLSMLEVSEAESQALARQGGLVTPDVMTRILDVLTETESKMRYAASRKIVLELGLLKAIDARNSVSLDTVIKRLQSLGAGGSAGSGSGQAARPAPAGAATKPGTTITPAAGQNALPTSSTAPGVLNDGPGIMRQHQAAEQTAPAAPISPAATAAPESAAPKSPQVSAGSPGSGTAMDTVWNILLSTASRMARPVLEMAHPVSLTKTLFTVGVPPELEGQIGILENPRLWAALKEKLAEAGFEDLKMKVVKAETPQGFVRPEPKQTVPEPASAPAKKAAPSESAQPQVPLATARKAELPPLPGKERAAAPPPFDKEAFKNDPLIQKALEIFKGQIVDIRPGTA